MSSWSEAQMHREKGYSGLIIAGEVIQDIAFERV